MDIISYVQLIGDNPDVWQQGIYMGMLLVGGAAMIGFTLFSLLVFFKMLSR